MIHTLATADSTSCSNLTLDSYYLSCTVKDMHCLFFFIFEQGICCHLLIVFRLNPCKTCTWGQGHWLSGCRPAGQGQEDTFLLPSAFITELSPLSIFIFFNMEVTAPSWQNKRQFIPILTINAGFVQDVVWQCSKRMNLQQCQCQFNIFFFFFLYVCVFS